MQGDPDDDDDRGHQGDGDYPGLLREEEEDHGVEHGEQGDEASSGEHVVPQPEGQVVGGTDEGTEQQEDGGDADDSSHVLTLDAGDEEGDRDDDGHDDRDDAELGPGVDDQTVEDAGEDGVEEDVPLEDAQEPGEVLLVGHLDGADEEVHHERGDEAQERILTAVGEGGDHDDQGGELVDERGDDRDEIVVVDPLGDHEDGDGGQDTDDG